MAAIVSFTLNGQKSLLEDNGKKTIVKAAIAICGAHVLLYLGGTAWLSVLTGKTFTEALGFAVYPFIPLDIVKIVFCVAVIVPLRSRLRGMRLLMLGAEA
jgi:biotin transporter BioY